jgi:hypothetical protein
VKNFFLIERGKEAEMRFSFTSHENCMHIVRSIYQKNVEIQQQFKNSIGKTSGALKFFFVAFTSAIKGQSEEIY